eukprot:6481846-Amphidinium_carterae.1
MCNRKKRSQSVVWLLAFKPSSRPAKRRVTLFAWLHQSLASASAIGHQSLRLFPAERVRDRDVLPDHSDQ